MIFSEKSATFRDHALIPLPGGVGDAPDRAAGVLGDVKRAIGRDRDADRPSPGGRIADHEAGGEIFEFAGRHAVLDDDADELGAGALAAIPRPMLRGEQAAAILRRELLPVIDRNAER